MTIAPAPVLTTTALYARISKDRRDGAGVERQLRECRELVDRRGWGPAAEYVDNSISASRYSRKQRPAYSAMVEQARQGRVQRIVCWNVDRLYRRPRELEDLIDLAEQGRVQVVSMTGELDLSASNGRAMARIILAMAAQESDVKSERILAQKAQNRALGKPHGGRVVGWKRTLMEPEPDEARLVLEGIDTILAGGSLNDVAKRWTALEVRGRRWNVSSVKGVLTCWHHAGLIVHKGEVVGKGSWQGIVTRAKLERVRAVIQSRSYRPGTPKRRGLLTGLVICAGCGQIMVRTTANGAPSFRCSPRATRPEACGRLHIAAAPVEQIAIEATFERVDTLDLAAAYAEQGRQASEYQAITAALAALQDREREIGQKLGAGRISPLIAETASNGILVERNRLTERLADAGRQDVLAPYAGRPGALRATWDDLPLDQRRAIIGDAIGAVHVLPTPTFGRNRFNPERLKIGPVGSVEPIYKRQADTVTPRRRTPARTASVEAHPV